MHASAASIIMAVRWCVPRNADGTARPAKQHGTRTRPDRAAHRGRQPDQRRPHHWLHQLPTAVGADGRGVVFVSDASDLVDGDTNKDADAFVRERDH